MSLESLRTRRSDDCLSDLQLDALLSDELSGPRREVAEVHLAACARCRDRVQQLRDHQTGFLREQPAFVPPRRAAGRAPVWAMPAAGLALAAAAACLLFVRGSGRDDTLGVRSKGDHVRVELYVRHGEHVRKGASGEHVAPNDGLRFVVTSRQPRYWAVLSRDGAGQASIYYHRGEHAVRIAASGPHALDASVVLDGVLGEEQVFALACDQARELAPLRAALADSSREPRWPEGCEVERITLVKEAGR
ncbi:MAG: hypothetical protein ABW321_21025 [Polyangiales bacterium]